MLKIAHVVTTFYSGMMSTNDISKLLRDQRQRGWQPELLLGRNALPELIQERRQQGFTVHQIATLRKNVNLPDDLKTFFYLIRFFKHNKFDVVHTHLAKAGILARLAARITGVKTIIHTVYGASFAPTLPRGRYLYFRSLEKLVSNFTEQFIFISKDIRDAYIAEGVCPADKAAVVYPGKDLTPFMAAASLAPEERVQRRQKAGFDAQQTIVLGMVGRIVPWKGHDYAIKALYELKKEIPNIKLMIVGAAKLPSEFGHQDKLIALAQSLGLAEDVNFVGWQDNTPFYYSIFDIYLITSMPFEGLSLSAMEAHASGLPVVGFKWYGAKDILGNNGRLVPAKDVPGLVQALKQEIGRLPETRRQRGNNLEEIIKLQKRHIDTQMLAETQELYRKLLAKRGDDGKFINVDN